MEDLDRYLAAMAESLKEEAVQDIPGLDKLILEVATNEIQKTYKRKN